MDRLVKKLVEQYPLILPRAHIYLRTKVSHLGIINKYIPKKGKVYELGCGLGLTSLYLGIKGKEREIIGLDLDKNKVKIANQVASDIKNVSFYDKDFRKDKEIKSADCVTCLYLLHHIPISVQVELLKETYSKLKKGGVLIIKEIDNKPLFKYIWNYISDKLMTFGGMINIIGSERLRNVLEDIGFKVEEKKIYGLLYPHYILICKK